MNKLFLTAFALYRQSFKTILQITLWVSLPLTVCATLLFSQYQGLGEGLNTKRLVLDGLQILLSLAELVLIIIFTKLAANSPKDKQTSARDLIRLALKTWPKVALSVIIMSVLLIPLYLLLVLPGLIFTLLWIFTPFIATLTPLSGWQAIRQSQKLIMKCWMKTGTVIVVILLFSYVLTRIIGLIISVIPNPIVGGVIGGLIYELIAPIFTIALTVYYLKVVEALE